MATKQVNLGKVMLTPRGIYNPERAYERLDIISYKGSSWLVLTPFEGVEPGNDNPHLMLLSAKGDTEKALIFDDLTPEQQLLLRGEKGEPGKGFVILGHYESLAQLESCEPNPASGDTYAVGNTPPYDIISMMQ
ncbi:MAG: hypothetical protein LIO97_10355 [Tannerellaceae bacterium]|nr:hypothetical protein [Tannerellaceae bacterium]